MTVERMNFEDFEEGQVVKEWMDYTEEIQMRKVVEIGEGQDREDLGELVEGEVKVKHLGKSAGERMFGSMSGGTYSTLYKSKFEEGKKNGFYPEDTTDEEIRENENGGDE